MMSDDCTGSCAIKDRAADGTNGIRKVEKEHNCPYCPEFPEVVSEALIPIRDGLINLYSQVKEAGLDASLVLTITRNWRFAILHTRFITEEWIDPRRKDLLNETKALLASKRHILDEGRYQEATSSFWEDRSISNAAEIFTMISILEVLYQMITNSVMPQSSESSS